MAVGKRSDRRLILQNTAHLARVRLPDDYWSLGQVQVQVAAVAGTLALPDVRVTRLPAGMVVTRAVPMFKFRMIENTDAAGNALDGATVAATSQVIQVRCAAPLTAYIDGIAFPDNYHTLDGSAREGGDVTVATEVAGIDVSSIVNRNGTYNFRWLLAKVDSDFINFDDVQVGLRIWYSI